ncbi:MAG: hypothetical protein EP330_15320 [Deltaproteobacteria bacterium]|nr:MAG: hypothetical protein EP330_15320 [Deltaproteobacteria bacterium]
MRHLHLALLIAMLPACTFSWEEGWMTEDWQSWGDGSLHAATRGIELSDDGSYGVAGMNGTTCHVDPQGWIGEDYDYDGETERVVDQKDDKFLVVTDDAVHVLDPDNHWMDDGSETTVVPGALDGCFDEHGDTVVIADNDEGCTLHTPDATIAVDDVVCDGTTDIDVVGDMALVETDRGSWIVDLHSGDVSPLDTGDLVAVTEGVAITGTTGEPGVQINPLDGSDAQAVPTSGRVVAIARQADGFAVIEAIDGGQRLVSYGIDGTELGLTELDDAYSGLTISGDGNHAALITGTRVDFLAL